MKFRQAKSKFILILYNFGKIRELPLSPNRKKLKGQVLDFDFFYNHSEKNFNFIRFLAFSFR